MGDDSTIQASPAIGTGLMTGRRIGNLSSPANEVRTHARRVVAWGAVLFLTVAVSGGVAAWHWNSLGTGTEPSLAATVSGIPVTMAEYRTQLDIARAMYGTSASSPSPMAQTTSQLVADRAMQQAIDDVLIDRASRRFGLSVSDTSIAGAVTRMAGAKPALLSASQFRAVAQHTALNERLVLLLHNAAWLDEMVANADIRYFVDGLSGPGSTTVSPGRAAPPFEATDLHGQAVSLTDLHGKAVVLNFWATWSGFSRSDLPLLLAFARQHTDLYVVALDDSESARVVRSFIHDHRLDGLTVWLDSGGRAHTSYGAGGIPATFFIDMHGILRSLNYGALPDIAALDDQAQLALRGMNNTGLGQSE